MPNWATCTISFAGPDKAVSAIRDAIGSGDDSNRRFDFDKLLPTPPELLEIASPMQVVADQERADAINKDFGMVRAVTQDTAQRFLTEYGAADWYHWRLGNWGTKWIGSDASILLDSPGQLIVRFDTAWTEPGQLLQTLASEHGLTITGGVIYEDGSEFAAVAACPDGQESDADELFAQQFVLYELVETDENDTDISWTHRWIELAA